MMNENEILFGIINALQDSLAPSLCPDCFNKAYNNQIDVDVFMQDTGVCDRCGLTNELAYRPIIELQQRSGIDPQTWSDKYPRISRRKNKL